MYYRWDRDNEDHILLNFSITTLSQDLKEKTTFLYRGFTSRFWLHILYGDVSESILADVPKVLVFYKIPPWWYMALYVWGRHAIHF